ncbi:hypothetical protein JRC04_00500 [Mycolicibacterium sp. S2-37]|uniref:hypothetical protein n=1 Tax=Mycolicibacterium sp. S2-37 TaxID=2810297 RepID=UPI001A941744|nr:hypothetical protein [Mycolicibacterium sp. S2-37]MBO0675933.1 hypothetical protein [Mycolicibacterium sp. S2-37]
MPVDVPVDVPVDAVVAAGPVDTPTLPEGGPEPGLLPPGEAESPAGVSAWATAVPFDSDAQTPRATAPVPSHRATSP